MKEHLAILRPFGCVNCTGNIHIFSKVKKHGANYFAAQTAFVETLDSGVVVVVEGIVALRETLNLLRGGGRTADGSAVASVAAACALKHSVCDSSMSLATFRVTARFRHRLFGAQLHEWGRLATISQCTFLSRGPSTLDSTHAILRSRETCSLHATSTWEQNRRSHWDILR